jgi:hypothetical protein
MDRIITSADGWELVCNRFTFKKMIPETGEELTALWGRKIVYNLLTTYGIIGNVTSSDFIYYASGGYLCQINLQLTKTFHFPPHIYLYNTTDRTKIFDFSLARAYISGDVLFILAQENYRWLTYRIFGY